MSKYCSHFLDLRKLWNAERVIVTACQIKSINWTWRTQLLESEKQRGQTNNYLSDIGSSKSVVQDKIEEFCKLNN